MTRRAARAAGLVLNAAMPLVLCVSAASAAPDLRKGRPAGSLTVYPDDVRPRLYYYAPGELAIATREGGAPDVHLLHVRYTGSVVTRDQGTALLRSIFSVRVVLSGPTAAQLAEGRKRLADETGASVELRPLPIRRLESAIVYAPIVEPAAAAASPGSPGGEPASPRALPAGHFEPSERAATSPQGYWSERVYTLRLAAEDAQVLSTALERGQVAVSIGYAFVAEGIAPEQPVQELTGTPVLVQQLTALLTDPPRPSTPSAGAAGGSRLHVVRAGAIGITADLAAWPEIVRRMDINEAVPPAYAALDVHCYDFQAGESPLYEKQIQIEAAGVGGRPVTIGASFTRTQPDLYARSVRFPVAVRLDRPFRFRVVEIARDCTSTTTAWREQASWTQLLDVTTQGDR